LVQILQAAENKTPVRDPNLQTLMKSLTSAGKHIRGSPYCKQGYRKEIFGLMIKFGMPPLWITISPAVVHSPIFLRLAGYEVDLTKITLADIPSAVERAKIVASDPVAAAKFFNVVIDSFTSNLLGYNQSEGGIFGDPSAFYGCIEEQGTGTLHIHMLVWLKGFKTITDLESELDDETFRNDLIHYLEKIIKQGYLGDTESVQEVDVSEVSSQRPIDPSLENFEQRLNDDVNKLVKVANAHRHSFTCYKYRKTRECRFGFPRELHPETFISEDEIKMKRTNASINNFNPIVMTSVRSNHDIKFIPSGKDGKACVFYMTDYATKSQLSTHQMLPLIAASKKVIESSQVDPNIIQRSKQLITKCLNRITTEVEISGSHVSHFLLGHSDKKTSHLFMRLNLHVALAWINEEMKKYDDLLDENDSSDEEIDEESTGYSILHGNNGLVLVNQMTDYINRGDKLSHVPLYKYCATIYKTTLTAEERKKLSNNNLQTEKRRGRKPQLRYLFKDSHPQSETHLQVTRADPLIPALSLLPPSEDGNKERFHICMLALFKPFQDFDGLYNGISWDDTFQNTDFGVYTNFIKNIHEMHVGLKEKDDARNTESNCDDETLDTDQEEEAIDFVLEELNNATNTQSHENYIDTLTSQALDIIKSSGCMDRSQEIHHSFNGTKSHQIPSTFFQQRKWQMDIQSQGDQILQSMLRSSDTIEPLLTNTNTENEAFPFSTSRPEHDGIYCVTELTDELDIDNISSGIISRFSLNQKQKIAFELAVQNVIKREKKEEVRHLMAYVGGQGDTGKSQIIKAIVAFHEELNIKYKLRLCAFTGTAAKHIGGCTITSLAGFGSISISNLEKKWNGVETIILDEVSMVGCILLAKLSRNATRAKHGDPSVPFGGIDIIYFGDFIQFPPVFDTPLYWAYNKEKLSSSTRESEVKKQIGRSIWKQVTHIIFLDEQMRVTDQKYLDILDRIREGKALTSKSLSGTEYILLA